MLRVESDYTHVESDLPAIVRTSCVGDSVLHFVEGEFGYFDKRCGRIRNGIR